MSWKKCEEAANRATSFLSRYRETYTLMRAPYLIVSEHRRLWISLIIVTVVHHICRRDYTRQDSSTAGCLVRIWTAPSCVYRRSAGELCDQSRSGQDVQHHSKLDDQASSQPRHSDQYDGTTRVSFAAIFVLRGYRHCGDHTVSSWADTSRKM